MKIAYTSLKSFKRARPDPTVIVVTLSDSATEVEEVPNTKWKRHYIYPFKVMRPSCPDGSFLPMREQAAKLAEWLKTVYTGENMIFQCQYGKIRSRAVAVGVHLGLRFNQPVNLYFLDEGNWVADESGSRDLGLFEIQTYNTIRGILRKHFTDIKAAAEAA